MRVLHGMSEVAGQGIYSVKGLRENGIDAKMAVWRKNPLGYPCDFCLNIGKCRLLYPVYFLKMLAFAVYALFKFDCFHFHFGWSLLPGGMDLKIIKLFKKKVIGLNCMKPKANMSSISEKTEQVGQKRNDIPWNLGERSTC